MTRVNHNSGNNRGVWMARINYNSDGMDGRMSMVFFSTKGFRICTTGNNISIGWFPPIAARLHRAPGWSALGNDVGNNL